METISTQLLELQKIQKSFGIFSKKTESLSRLKLSFFEKMKAYEASEDIPKAHAYFGYLIRTTTLSQKVYQRINNELVTNLNYLNTLSLDNTKQLEGTSELDRELVELFSIIDQFLIKTKASINTLYNGENSINRILNLITEELKLMESIDHQPAAFFDELEIQRKLHNLFINEETISNLIINEIKSLEKYTKTFSQKMRAQILKFNLNLKRIITQIKQRPLQSLLSPFETVGIKLEKNASIFAATIFALSLIANMSTLLGVGGITLICKELILIMAEVGEPLQAIPAIKSAFIKFKNNISVSIQRALSSMQEIQAVS